MTFSIAPSLSFSLFIPPSLISISSRSPGFVRREDTFPTVPPRPIPDSARFSRRFLAPRHIWAAGPRVPSRSPCFSSPCPGNETARPRCPGTKRRGGGGRMPLITRIYGAKSNPDQTQAPDTLRPLPTYPCSGPSSKAPCQACLKGPESGRRAGLWHSSLELLVVGSAVHVSCHPDELSVNKSE